MKKILFLLNFQTYKNFDVIVVHTSSKTDIYIDFEINYNLKFIKGYKTKAFARNLGITRSNSEYILLIDSDMLPHPYLIEQHLSLLRNSADIVVGLELRTVTEKEYKSIIDILDEINDQQKLINLFQREFSNRSRKIATVRKIQWYKFLTGNLSSRRELFIKAGMFDHNFISYGFEDLELGYRMQKIGANIILNPNALTIHLHPLPISERIKNKKESVKNLRMFYHKYGNDQIIKTLGINFYSKIIYDYLPEFLVNLLKSKSQDYVTNYYFWKEWNTKN